MAEQDYKAETEQLEQRAEEHAPGVLDLLDVYGRAGVPAPDSWQGVNQGVVRQSSGTSAFPQQQHQPLS